MTRVLLNHSGPIIAMRKKFFYFNNKLSLVDSVLLSTPLSFVIFYPLYVFYTYCMWIMKTTITGSLLTYLICSDQENLRDGPLENLWGAGEVQKKYSRNGKLSEKNSCTPINPKKYSCHGLTKIHTRNLITKKIPAARKFLSPPPPHNFSNGPSLSFL